MTTNLNILITSVSKKVWLVEAFRNALTQLGIEGRIVSADTDPFSAGLYVSDAHYIVPPSSDPYFMPRISEICKKESINLLVPSRNGELLPFANCREKFKKDGVTVLVSDPEIIEICNDKYSFYQFLIQENLPAPMTFLPSQMSFPVLKYPLIIKPRCGSGSKNTFKVMNQPELEFMLKYVPDAIMQEFIEGKEYTVDVLSDFDNNVITVVPRERIVIFGGESFKGRTVRDHTLIGWAKKLAESLRSVGHITIQCLVNDAGLKFIEVNPRFGGGATLGIAAGANTPLLILKLVMGEKVKPMIGEFKENVVMLRYTKDIFINGKTKAEKA